MGAVKSGYGKRQGKFKKKTQFWLGDKDLVLRILPVSDLFTSDPYNWQKYHAVVKGYKNSEGKLRMFESPLQKKNKEVVIPCAATERFENLKTAYNKAVVEQKGDVAKQLNELIGIRGVYNIEKKWHMNVMALDGTVGTLGINYSTKAELDREIDRLQAEGVDPLSLDNGRFFVFSKSNAGSKTTFSVRTLQQDVEIQGRKLKEDVVSKIGPEQWVRVERDMSDLDSLYIKVTSEEVAQIVKESDLKTGKSPACDRIFDERWKTEREARKVALATPADTPTQESEEDYDEVETLVNEAVKASTTVQSQTVATPVQNQVATVVTSSTTPSVGVAEMSDEDFFKTIGVTA